VNQLLCQPGAEELIRRLGGEVLKGQNGDCQSAMGRRLNLRPSKHRDVATPWKIDAYGVASTLASVVLLQFRAEPPRLDADNGVDAGIVIGGPVEYLHPNQRLFQIGSAASQRFFDGEAQESLHAFGIGKRAA